MHHVAIVAIVAMRPYLVLIVLCLALYLPGLAAVPPLDRDEARFAQATRQMLETNDFVRIRFQETPRHKKPAGIYWLQAATVTVTGDAAAIWSYRLPSVAGAVMAVLLTFHFGQALFDRRTAWLGAALLGSALMVVIEAHQAKTDAVLLACVVAAQGALARFYGHVAPTSSPRTPPGLGTAIVFWLAQGIGILIKGPIVPLVSGLTLVGLGVWERRWPRWLWALRPLVGVPVLIAVVAPWLVAVSLATDGAFIGEAVRTDLLPKVLGAQESHGAPPGYFLLLTAFMFWPASLFLWPALVRSWRVRNESAVRFCLAWVGPTWLLFEAVPTKLPHYILPVYPALALLVAAAVLSGEVPSPLAARWARAWYGLWAVLTAALAGGFLAAPVLFGREAMPWSALPAAGAVLAAAGGAVWFAWRRRFLPAMAGASVGAGLAVGIVFAGLMPSLNALWLSQRVHDALAPHARSKVVTRWQGCCPASGTNALRRCGRESERG
ncbi:MAG: glycosyltransferase [Rhodospirillaceae bacterium]|nr:MAG: glycosyltransferase [Rhodospirillaceae bacterium]